MVQSKTDRFHASCDNRLRPLARDVVDAHHHFTLICSNKSPVALTMRPSAARAERLRSRILRMMLSLLWVSLAFIYNLFLCLPYGISIRYCLWNCKGGSKTFTKKFTAHPSQADRRSGSHRAFLIDELLISAICDL